VTVLFDIEYQVEDYSQNFSVAPMCTILV